MIDSGRARLDRAKESNPIDRPGGATTSARRAFEPRLALALAVVIVLGGLVVGLSSAPARLVGRAARALPASLGFDGDRVYLILLQDAAELRPTGGFIGNYGIIRMRNGRPIERRFGDTYQLDVPYFESGASSPPVDMFDRYLFESTFWGLRDSNIWPDFPTSARRAAAFGVDEGAAERIDGVIAVSSTMATRLLHATGPIEIPEFGETITAENYEERIRFYQLDAGQSLLQERFGASIVSRKIFTAAFLQAFTQRLTRPSPGLLLRLAPELRAAAVEKEILAYLDDPDLEALVTAVGLGGEMKPIADDYLWVVDMNLSATKDNQYIRQTVRYEVDLTQPGRQQSYLTITYDYRTTGNRFLGLVSRLYYGDLLRTLVPPGVRLVGDGGPDDLALSPDGDRMVLEAFLKIMPGSMHVLRARYERPRAVPIGAEPDRYHLLIQKQPGSNINDLEVILRLPDGASVVDAVGLTRDGSALRYQGALASDLSLTVRFARP